MGNTNLILAVTMVVCGLFLYFSEFHDIEGREDARWEATRVVNFEPDNVFKVRMTYTRQAFSEPQTFTIERKEDDHFWEIVSPIKDMADKNEVETIIGHLYNLKNVKEFSSDIQNSDEFGFNNPRAQISLYEKQPDGTIREIGLILGRRSPVEYLSYMKVQGKEDIYLVKGGIDDFLTKSSSDLRQRKLFSIKNRSDISSLSVTIGTDKPMILDLKAGQWSTPTPFPCPVHQPAADDLADGFRSLIVDFFVDEEPEELASYGLNKPAIIIETTLTNGEKLELYIGEMASGTLEEDPSREISGWYCRTNLRKTVYVIAEYQYKKLAKRLIDIRDRTITPEFTIDDINKVAFTFVDKSQAFIERKGTHWLMDKADRTNIVCDKTYVEKLIGALSNLQAKAVISDYENELYKSGLNAPDLVMELHNSVEDEILTVALKWNNKGDIFIQNTSRPTSFAIDSQLINLFPEKSMDLCTRSPLRALQTASITKAVIEAVAMETIVLTSEKNDSQTAKWTLHQPESSMLQEEKVEEWFTRLRGLKVARFIDEGKENRKLYGLVAPLATTTITYKAKDSTEKNLVISIGAQTSNKLFYYCMTSNIDGIFTIRTSMARHLLIPAITYKKSVSIGESSQTTSNGDTVFLNGTNPHHYVPLPDEEASLPKAIIHTSLGSISVILFEDEAPNHVANFIFLAENNFYNNTTFHRVEDFCIQGGDPNTKDNDPSNDGKGHPGYSIKDEISPKRNHKQYYLSMAHTGPDTGGSQFFILKKPAPWLDGIHTVFGAVIDGGDIVDSIIKGTLIEEISIIHKRDHKYIPEKTPRK